MKIEKKKKQKEVKGNSSFEGDRNKKRGTELGEPRGMRLGLKVVRESLPDNALRQCRFGERHVMPIAQRSSQ